MQAQTTLYEVQHNRFCVCDKKLDREKKILLHTAPYPAGKRKRSGKIHKSVKKRKRNKESRRKRKLCHNAKRRADRRIIRAALQPKDNSGKTGRPANRWL